MRELLPKGPEPTGSGAGSALRRYAVLVTAAVLVVVAGVLLLVVPGGRAQIGLSFTRLPEPFLALAIADPAVIPTRDGVTVRFVVATTDMPATTIGYRVVVRDPQDVPLGALSGTTATVPHASSLVDAQVTLPPGARWSTAQVTLPGRQESLLLHGPDAPVVTR